MSANRSNSFGYSTHVSDNELAQYVSQAGFAVFRGALDDVLDVSTSVLFKSQPIQSFVLLVIVHFLIQI